jgi:hypothetical protein
MIEQNAMSMQPPNPVDSSWSGRDIDFAAWVDEVNHELPVDYGVGNEPAKWTYLNCTVMASETDFREETEQPTSVEVAFYPSGYRTMPRRKKYPLTKTDASAAAQDIRNFLKRGEFPSVPVR